MRKIGGLGVVLLLMAACQSPDAAPTERRATASTSSSTAAPTSTTPPSSTTTTTAPGPTTWRLMAVGDVLLDDTETAGLDAFAHVVPRLGDADLAIVNLETAVGPEGAGTPEAKTFVFRSPPSAATTLARAGVDIANVANNHSLDYGPDVFVSGIDTLRGAGVEVVGGGRNLAAATAPVQRTIGGVRVAVVGASRVIPNHEWAARADHPGVAPAYDIRGVSAQVQRAKANADVVVVVVHWGTEGSACPEPEITGLGAALLRAGASVVLGSHPHVLQPIVRNDTGLIAYSLGNFAFHRRSGPTGDSVVLELGFNGSQLASVTTHPHSLNQGRPQPADAAGAARVRAALDPAACPGLV